MNLRVLLVDDEPLALDLLNSILGSEPDVEIVGLASDGDEATAKIEELRPDVVLSDIRMPRHGGLKLAQALKDDPDVDVIFVTAFDQFALHAYDMDVVDYILKPVEEDRLKMALNKVRKRRSTGTDAPVRASSPETGLQGFWVQKPQGSVWIPAETIEWIEAARDYVLLQTPTSSHILRSTMDGLEHQLDSDSFVRVSRSAIVRLGAVTRFYKQGSAGSIAVLASGVAVKIGGKFARAAEQKLGSLRP